ncbi:MAG: phosphate acyltransferase PlsX [Rhodobacteraceae bacterium]|nr:phosphate acyltransferase PlsX [Paracoccaceae bacterium]
MIDRSPHSETLVKEAAAPVIAVDAMGGDRGPEIVVAGVARALSAIPNLRVLLFGDEMRLTPHLPVELAERAAIRHCDSVITMDEAPVAALRRGRGSSMWRTLDAVSAGEADAAISAGNTGALMTMSLVRLKAAPAVERPAIAALWPSRNAAGYNVVLDVGANLRGEARDLVSAALLGAEYAKIVLDTPKPRVALLNVGVEEHKGRAELHAAAAHLTLLADAPDAPFVFTGFIEGDRIAERDADVIATDGFTGNVALKTAEGAASLIGGYLREALSEGWRARLGALLAAPALAGFKRRVDPRRVNGGVFLGLNGVVVKSHGGADAVGFASAIDLAARLAKRDIAGRVAAQVAKIAFDGESSAADSSSNLTAGSR